MNLMSSGDFETIKNLALCIHLSFKLRTEQSRNVEHSSTVLFRLVYIFSLKFIN